jgi:hypothetical protein
MLIDARGRSHRHLYHTGSNMALLTECETLWLFGSYKHCTHMGCPS